VTIGPRRENWGPGVVARDFPKFHKITFVSFSVYAPGPHENPKPGGYTLIPPLSSGLHDLLHICALTPLFVTFRF